MTIGSSPRRHILGALLLLPALARCSTTPPSRLYTLAPRPGTPIARTAETVMLKRVAVPIDRTTGTVMLKRVEIAKYLDRPQIVRYSGPYELTTSEFDRWAESLSDMATRVMVANLSQRLPGSQVFAATGPLSMNSSNTTIELNIDRFDVDPGGSVILLAQWVIHHVKTEEFRSQEIHVATASSTISDQVAAMSDALGQLANQIAAGIIT
jgi:uncharacterized protein